MEQSQREICFVCDKKVENSGFVLNSEKTQYTKTAFPTRISQLIGDAFIVVITKEDRICQRCVSLINKFDKLEVDLMDIKNIITGFLIVKYDLNSEEDDECNLEDVKSSTLEEYCKNVYFRESPTVLSYNDSLVQSYKNKSNINRDSKSLLEVINNSNNVIKAIQNEECDEHFDNSNILKHEPSTHSAAENVLSKSSDGPCSHSTLNTNLGEETFDTGKSEQSDMLLSEVKKEEPVCNYSATNMTISCTEVNGKGADNLPSTQEQMDNRLSVPKYKSPLETNNILPFDEKQSIVQLSIANWDKNESSKIKSDFNIFHENVMKPPIEKDIKKAIPKHRSKKRYSKKCVNNIPVRKLRPILPKITNLGLIEIKINQQNKKETIPLNEKVCNIDKSKQIKAKYQSYSNPNLYRNSKEYIKGRKNTIRNKYNTSLKKNEDHNTNFLCKHCKSEFKSLENLKIHEKEHTEKEKNYKCSFCQKNFKTKAGHRNHEAVHTGKFSFYCDFCGRGYMSRGGLEGHRNSHLNEVRYICEVCGKKFTFQSTYWIHRKWHDNPYPYKCKDCGRLFKHSSLLSVHRRKHTGERPYKCSFCSLTFTVSNTLKRHMILHTKKFPFYCEVCNQGLTTRFKYTEHLVKLHNIIIDKPNEKKDYKMAIHDNGTKNNSLEKTNDMEEINFESSECNTTDVEIAINSFSDLNESVVEIVLEPSSMLTDPYLTLSEDWLV